MSDNKKVVIALGYFDGVHKGHQKVIKTQTDFAKKVNAKTVVFTFKSNIRSILSGEEQKYVYSPKEREEVILSLGVNEVLFAPNGKSFLNKGKRAFLNWLNSKYDIKAYVCGEDFRFGRFASGDVEYLKEYAISRGQEVITVDTYLLDGKKLSTTDIKRYLSSGKIEKANAELCKGYFVNGKVFRDRNVGRKLGFPTANILIDEGKQPLKHGVYSCEVRVDGNLYKAICNFGARPTFDLKKTLIEVHVIDHNLDLYGKEIIVYFKSFVRDVIKFDNEKELTLQIQKDIEKVKSND